jgi:putative aminopeptidase FrvX
MKKIIKKKSKESSFGLLRDMCEIHAPSGNESAMTEFILSYVKTNASTWKQMPKVYAGKGFQDNVVLVFGKPRTAVFAHLDSIGFTVRYGKQLVKVGGPVLQNGFLLSGTDSKGTQMAELQVAENKETGALKLTYKAARDFETGTDLVFKADWREDDEYVQCCYMDNRLGVYTALKLAETLKNGAIVFSTWEEHGGGSVAYLQRFLFEKFNITQGLISDISWISDGVHPGKGPVISLRDSLIPRRSYVNKIVTLAQKFGCAFQLEVEGSGGSDGKELQMAAAPWDWCFIGAAEQHVHSPNEKVHKKDIAGMIELYKMLMKEL